MKRLTKKLFSPPSLKLNTMVVCEVVSLLVASLAVLFYFSYQTLKDEAMQDAEQTLEGTVQHIDNVLLSIEQATGNIYWDMLEHLDEPDRMETYCRELVECNSYIQGCAVAFKPGFYPEERQSSFYVHYNNNDKPSELITEESIGTTPYTEQEWYTIPMTTGHARWIGPFLKDGEEKDALLTFSLPITSNGTTAAENGEKQIVGILAVDLSVEQLSRFVLSAKPSPNSYCVLLNHSGEYIIHPNKAMLKHHTVFDMSKDNPALREIAEAMVAGKTGSSPFTLNGKNYYKFYKPFMRTKVSGRSIADLNWSVGLIYPERDLFGMFYGMLKRVLIIAAGGLLLFFLLCRIVFRWQMKPLRVITESAQRIADGHYDDPVSDSHHNDEIGLFQQHFQEMQRTLTSRISELRELRDTLQERGEKLRKTREQMLKDSQVKGILLHKMTDEIKVPSEVLLRSVTNLCDNYQDISLQEANSEIATIKQQGEAILTLLNQMLNTSDEEVRKEVSHE